MDGLEVAVEMSKGRNEEEKRDAFLASVAKVGEYVK